MLTMRMKVTVVNFLAQTLKNGLGHLFFSLFHRGGGGGGRRRQHVYHNQPPFKDPMENVLLLSLLRRLPHGLPDGVVQVGQALGYGGHRLLAGSLDILKP